MSTLKTAYPNNMNPVNSPSTKTINLYPRKLARSLFIVVAILLAAYVLSALFEKIMGVDSVLTQAFYYAFDMDGEDNVPAAFSFLILFSAAALLLSIAFITAIKTHKKFWLILSFIFMFLACDEFMQIHEHLGLYMKEHTTKSVGGSNFVWVLPYGIFALTVGILLMRFLFQLPKKTRNLFFLSGFIYVFSALIIDYVQGIIQKQGLEKIYYKMLTCIEEPGEMIGVILFIYALLDYIVPVAGPIKIELAEKPSEKAVNN